MRLAWRLLWREWRAGELRLLAGALLVAVAAITTVGFFTDRVQRALDTQAGQLLAADLVVAADHEISPALLEAARARGLRTAETRTFRSVVVQGDHTQFVEVKAVGPGYPLRGTLRTSPTAFGAGVARAGGPQAGAAWADARLAQAMGLRAGERVRLGEASLMLDAFIEREPDRAGDFFNIAPRLMVAAEDLPRTGLIQPGSRIHYRLLLAGEARAIAEFRAWAAPRLARGERMEGIGDARPEIRDAMQRAQRYLGLAALVSAILAAVAVALAGRQYLARHLDASAVLRCLGASHAQLFRLYLSQFVVLGTGAGVVGSLAGLAGQAVLAEVLRGRIVAELPAPSLRPLFEGTLIGLLLLLAFVMPPLLHLIRVPSLRVIRRDLGPTPGRTWLSYGLGASVVAAILVYRAGEVQLGLYVLGGLFGVGLLGWASAELLLRLLAGMRRRAHGLWFYGLSNVVRRRAASLTQILGFALGLMALLLLTLVRGDLMASWQGALPPDAPNRFIVNIQPDQLPALHAFFAAEHVNAPQLYPMVRGRLIQINTHVVSARDYAEERAKHLVEREFNLSAADAPRADYEITAGHWWRTGESPEQFSVEEGLAKILGIHLGDVLTYEVAGSRVSGRVTSLRKVAWDRMQVNFFVIAPSALLAQQPRAFITSFHLPAGQEALLSRMLVQFPNLTVIDVAALIDDVRAIMERVAGAVTFVFFFTLLAGVAVLYAAVLATRNERLYEAAVMRTLGARSRQLAAAQWVEFASLGIIAGLLAATGASAVAWVLALKVLHLPVHFNPWVWIVGVTGGAAGIMAAGLAATRSVLREPPLGVLRALQ